jgi:uncharacterized protein YndB with AHSA1/START domain
MTADLGTLEHDGDRVVLRFTRRIGHPPERVWRALTEDARLEAWFPTTIEGERRAGAPLRFTHRYRDIPVMEGEMLGFDPPRLLELRWGDDVLRFELEADGPDATVLVFTDTFPELGRAARDGAGWHACLDVLAYAAGDGEQPPWSAADRWAQVKDGYVERFGPAASTIGPPGE